MVWVKDNLGNRLKVISGYAFKSLDFLDIKEKNIPVIKIKNIKNGFVDIENDIQYVSNEKINIDNKFKVFNGDILISLTGSQITQPNSVVGRIAKCYFNDDQIALLNQRAGKFIIDKEKLNKDFLFYLLSNDKYKQKLALMGHGAANQANISPSQVESLEVYLPDKVEEQQKIAKILSNYDDLIENNNKRIKILEEMAQKIYKEWFVDFKYPGHETATFKDTEIGKIPSDWEITKVETYYNTSSGGTPSRKEPSYYDKGTINWVKTGELKNTFIIDTEEKITDLAIKKSSAKLFVENTIVLAMYCGMGDISIMSKPMATNQACCVFIPKYDYLDYPFTYLFFNNITKEMTNISFGAAQQNLSQEVIKAYIVKFPNKKTIVDFSYKVKPIFEQIKNLLFRNNTLKQTRDLLLPRLMSGEINVENLEIA